MIPHLCWSAAKPISPTFCPGVEIDGGGSGSYESIRTEARRIPQKIDPLQTGAAIERVVPDAFDAVANRHVGQAGAAIERVAPDNGDAVGDRIEASLSRGVYHKDASVLVEQNPIHAGIYRIVGIDVNRFQAGAARERVGPDAFDAVANRHAGQAGAARERGGLDAGDAVGDRHAGQTGATPERGDPDAGDAVGDRHAGQAGAASERVVPDAGHRQAIDRCGYAGRTSHIDILCNRDLAASGGVKKLRLHHDWHRQQNPKVK